MTITNSTISANQAHDGLGGGIINFDGSVSSLGTPAPEMTLRNTIVSGNPGGDCSGAVTSQGSNLDGDGSCSLGEGDLSNTDPLLGPLQDNDGPSFTHALGQNSPAIDAGGRDSCPETDQRGAARLIDGDGDGQADCDIGAYEAPPFQPSTASRSMPAVTDFSDALLAFVMIGNPVLSEDPDPLAFFVQAFGPPQSDLWRLFRYDAALGDYREILSGDDFDFSPGLGFWLLARNGGTLPLSGTPNDATGAPYEMVLEPGFQQIATPFNFTLKWTGCIACPDPGGGAAPAPGCASRLPEGVSPSLWGYDGINGGYALQDDMEPFFGYWVRNASESPLILSIPPVCAKESASEQPAGSRSLLDRPAAGRTRPIRHRPQRPSTAEGWRVRLSVAAGELRDDDNYLGIDLAGRDGQDRLDYPEPPPLHGLWLSFYHPEWDESWPHFAADIRQVPQDRGQAVPQQDHLEVWHFEIRMQIARTQVQLSWSLEGIDGSDLTLFDLDANRTIDMGRAGSYIFDSGMKAVRRFQVIARTSGEQ